MGVSPPPLSLSQDFCSVPWAKSENSIASILKERLEAWIGCRGASRLVGVSAEALRDLDQWRGLLGQNTSIARQLLRKVLNGRLAFTPRSDGVELWYEFAAQGTLEKFFEGVPAIKAVVPVRGFEPRFDG